MSNNNAAADAGLPSTGPKTNATDADGPSKDTPVTDLERWRRTLREAQVSEELKEWEWQIMWGHFAVSRFPARVCGRTSGERQLLRL